MSPRAITFNDTIVILSAFGSKMREDGYRERTADIRSIEGGALLGEASMDLTNDNSK